jgi:predicted O-linked N-acetylglucosamine transferase (SPINDLY family)
MAPPPAPIAAALRTANARAQAGRFAEAEAIYRQQPAVAEVLLAWGQLRRRMGDLAAGRELLERACAAGGGVSALVALADLHLDRLDLASAQPLARQALALAPKSPELNLLVGRAAEMTGKLDAAATAYRAAMHADPKLLPARLGLARVLGNLGRDEEALGCYNAAVRRWPDSVDAQIALGRFHGQRHRFSDAVICFDKAAGLGAEVTRDLSSAAVGLAYTCDWGATLGDLRRRLHERLRQPAPCLIDPYAVICHEDDPAALLRLGEHMSGTVAEYVRNLPKPAIVQRQGDPRIRLGYLSGDFNQHALSLLMADVFAKHDRSRFEVIAYSFSQDDGSDTRRRVVAAFDRFVELGLESPALSAKRIAGDGIDILIDLKGYADGGRPEIQALRPAPVQVTHLGYQATLGAPWVDYVIADAVVAPFSEQPNWSERIVHLPESYFPNDRLRPVNTKRVARTDHGLPATGVVFACFNQTFKITEEVFTLWLGLLRDTPGSVLWLMSGVPQAPSHLRQAAQRAGVAPERLVFANPVPLPDHLARHDCADLFLDTAPYGAHTTACDALWTGLPVVTLPGQSFASRVGASLLRAVGMDELIATTADEYRAIALALAQDPAARAGLRARLIAARTTAPLFDSARFAGALGAAYVTMHSLHRSGSVPRGFAIGANFQPVHQPV